MRYKQKSTIMHITIERLSDDGLQRTDYTFYLADNLKLTLNDYWTGKRETKRHNFKQSGKWSRLSSRDSTIQRTEFTLPADVIAEALQQGKDSISFSE